MFIIMLEVEARQAVKWYPLPFTRNSVHCMSLYLSWKMFLASCFLGTFILCKCFITKLVPFESFFVLFNFFETCGHIFDPYRNARRIVVNTAECLHVVMTSWQHMTHTAVLGQPSVRIAGCPHVSTFFYTLILKNSSP